MMKSAKNLLTDGRLHDFYVGKSLTVFQFSVAIILLISVFAIYSQLKLYPKQGFRRSAR